ncbi:MAG: transglycosylase SLT domain-containing protein [Gammaproteobacteria bacterium]|jgi:soluble lytic murein transglycosylase|nr:transglycosylase SLT domain-containing protein [Gammaproteobacteria bacterium]
MILRTWTVSIALLLTSIFWVPSALTEPLPPDDLVSQRVIYLRAEHALKKNDHVNFERLSQKITTYPLYPYLVYDDLKRKIQAKKSAHISLDRIQQFQINFPDFPFNNSLKNLWLLKMAQNKDWAHFLKGYQSTNNVELACYYHLANYEVNKESALLEKAKEYYLVGYSQPASCDQLFKAWAKAGGLTQKLIWKRTALALEEKNFTLADHLIKQLSASERIIAHKWEKLIKNPYLLFDDSFLHQLNASDKIKAQIITSGLQILAKQEPEKALKWWQTHKNNYSFSVIQSNIIQRDIGVFLSHHKSPNARSWLALLPDNTIDSTAIEWRIRLALAESDWNDALMWINRLPPEIKDDKSWLYWRARALEAQGHVNEANAIYSQLTKARNYYAFVASLRLKQPLSMHHQQLSVEPHIADQVSKMPAMQRFQELQILGKDPVGRVEWFRAIDRMNEQEILAAAKIAQKMGLHDIAIFTIGKTDFRDDIPLRFPLAHQKEIIDNANKHNIDPAWIFGIARQESAFFTEAVSHAGARGLLQLMPTTAKSLAKKYEIEYESELSLHEPKINVQIGTLYLKNLKQQMRNHPILATASYNAGPTRTMRWLPKTQQEADIWIETIPYKETREYVKNVLAFTSIYRQRLGYPCALTLMMKPIPAKST